MIFPCVKLANTKKSITKYTNTAYDEVQKDPACGIYLKNRFIQGYKKILFVRWGNA